MKPRGSYGRHFYIIFSCFIKFNKPERISRYTFRNRRDCDKNKRNKFFLLSRVQLHLSLLTFFYSKIFYSHIFLWRARNITSTFGILCERNISLYLILKLMLIKLKWRIKYLRKFVEFLKSLCFNPGGGTA